MSILRTRRPVLQCGNCKCEVCFLFFNVNLFHNFDYGGLIFFALTLWRPLICGGPWAAALFALP
jgi:hypothetical protein